MDVAAEGRLSAFHAELTPGNPYEWWNQPADGRDLAHSILGWVVGNRAAATYAAAFRDEVLAMLSPTGWELTEREILGWLQAR